MLANKGTHDRSFCCVLLYLVSFCLVGCFRPAPPLEEGDGIETQTESIESADAPQGANRHPLVRKRKPAQQNSVNPGPVEPQKGSTSGSTNPPLSTPTSASAWIQESYLKASNAGASDAFGFSMALSGDALAIGAPGEDSNQNVITNGNGASTNDSLSNSGAVYVYRRNGTTWVQEAYVKPVNAGTSDAFGFSVAIVGDLLAVGATGEASNQSDVLNGSMTSENNSLLNSGAVYIYRRTVGNWEQEAYVKALWPAALDAFGCALSLSGDTLLVGANREDYNQRTITNGDMSGANRTGVDSGAVFVYRYDGLRWAQEAYIKASNSGTNNFFGTAVSISGDTLVVGAPGESSSQTVITSGGPSNTDGKASSSGAVYVFRRSGATWEQEAWVKATNAETGDEFGTSVALSGDTLVVGAPYEDSSQTQISNAMNSSADNIASGSGAVYVYRRSATQWSQEAYLKAANAEAGDVFGSTLALAGNTLAVGAKFEDSKQNIITNGNLASTDNSEVNSGAVYVFRRNGAFWTQEGYLKAGNAESGDEFGTSVALSGDTLAVGASGEDSSQTSVIQGSSVSVDNSASQSGSVFVYRNHGRMFDPDVQVTGTTATSVSFSLRGNLGVANQVIVAPVALWTASAVSNCAGGIVLAPEVTSYTYSGLEVGTRYGFRFCAWDGKLASGGTTVWAETNPQNFSSGIDSWQIINNQTPTASRNEVYLQATQDKMLGRLGAGESITKTFRLDGQSANMSFDFIRIDSWDHEYLSVYMTADSGNEVLAFQLSFQHQQLAFNQSGFRNGYVWSIASAKNNDFCFASCSWKSARHTISIRTPANISTLKVRITTGLDQTIDDESWGIDNFRLGP